MIGVEIKLAAAGRAKLNAAIAMVNITLSVCYAAFATIFIKVIACCIALVVLVADAKILERATFFLMLAVASHSLFVFLYCFADLPDVQTICERPWLMLDASRL